MRLKYIVWMVCTVLLIGAAAGCGQKNAVNAQAHTETASDVTLPSETASDAALPSEAGDDLYEGKGTLYSMKVERSDYPAPSLKLFDNGRFGFYFDVLSSYYPHGSYEIKDDKLTAVTDDGRFRYVFQLVSDQYVFVQAESSEVLLTDHNIGIPVTDGAQFILSEPETTVKEVADLCRETGKN